MCSFYQILQNYEACQVFGRMCSIVILAFTLKFPIQTLLSVVPTHSDVPHDFSKTSTPPSMPTKVCLVQYNVPTIFCSLQEEHLLLTFINFSHDLDRTLWLNFKKILIKNQYETICEPVRSECSSCRVLWTRCEGIKRFFISLQSIGEKADIEICSSECHAISVNRCYCQI